MSTDTRIDLLAVAVGLLAAVALVLLWRLLRLRHVVNHNADVLSTTIDVQNHNTEAWVQWAQDHECESDDEGERWKYGPQEEDDA